MRFCPKTLSPWFRWFAAVTLVTWIGTQALCQAHCLFDGCQGESDDADQHTTAAVAHPDEGTAPQPSHQDHGEDASCLTLKSALTSNATASLVTPAFSFLYALAPFTLAMDVTATGPDASLSRQARPREWVFTPEVCLGPAFRSHAPPFPSLI